MATRVSKKCTVVVVGKTGAGKSNVANHILGANEFVVKNSLRSVTVKPQIRERTHTTPDGKTYDVRVIDTPGFFDTDKSLANILEQIKIFASKDIRDGVNMVYFVFKVNRFTSEEQETFKLLMHHFKNDVSKVSALILTGCDEMTDDGRKDYIEKFRKNPDTRVITAFMEKGIYCVGFPDHKTAKPVIMTALEKDIRKDEEVIRQQLYCSEETCFLFNASFREKCRKACTIL